MVATMKLKPGLRLKSAVSDAEIMVIKAPALELPIQCAGVDMLELPTKETSDKPQPSTEVEGLMEIGKRYGNLGETVEVLCTKGGAGWLSVDGETLRPRQSKKLPSSD
jgi:hypothetical protein